MSVDDFIGILKPPKLGEIVYFKLTQWKKGEKWKKGKIVEIELKDPVTSSGAPYWYKDFILILQTPDSSQYEVYFKSLLPEGNHWRMKEAYFIIPK